MQNADEIWRLVDAKKGLFELLSDQVWDTPELCYTEFQSCAEHTAYVCPLPDDLEPPVKMSAYAPSAIGAIEMKTAIRLTDASRKRVPITASGRWHFRP